MSEQNEAMEQGQSPVMVPPKQSIGESLAVYKDWRMAKILLIGSMSGFPWVLIASLMSLWLKAEGLSRSGIGLFGLVFTIYAFNLLWAPLVDKIKLPVLHRLGQRRSWIVLMQSCIGVLMVLMSFFSPKDSLVIISVLAFLIALSNATMDVAVDAMRICLIKRSEAGKVGAASAMATSGWWLGFGGLGAVALALAQLLDDAGFANFYQLTYLAMVVYVVLSIVLLLKFVEEPDAEQAPVEETSNMAYRAAKIWIDPVKSFVVNYGIRIGVILLLMIVLFKVGEAFLGRMSIIFYKEIGFSKGDIALYSKGFGTLALCTFAVIGSIINARYGLFRGLLIGGIAMASTNLLFALLWVFPSYPLFAFAVIADQFTTAMSTVAFVAFISQLCERAFAATQYAAFASIGNFSRTTLAAGSGVMVDALGGNWGIFFVITTLMVLPSLALLWYVRKDILPLMAGQTTKIL